MVASKQFSGRSAASRRSAASKRSLRNADNHRSEVFNWTSNPISTAVVTGPILLFLYWCYMGPYLNAYYGAFNLGYIISPRDYMLTSVTRALNGPILLLFLVLALLGYLEGANLRHRLNLLHYLSWGCFFGAALMLIGVHLGLVFSLQSFTSFIVLFNAAFTFFLMGLMIGVKSRLMTVTVLSVLFACLVVAVVGGRAVGYWDAVSLANTPAGPSGHISEVGRLAGIHPIDSVILRTPPNSTSSEIDGHTVRLLLYSNDRISGFDLTTCRAFSIANKDVSWTVGYGSPKPCHLQR